MTTLSQNMDLPDLATHEANPEPDAKKDELISSKSSDTGFVSDSTYDSPISDYGKDLSEEKEVTEDKLIAEDKTSVDDNIPPTEDASTIEEKATIEDSTPMEEKLLKEDKSEKDESHINAIKSEEKDQSDSEEKEDDVDILGNGQLRKKILVPGNGVNTRPNNGDTVTLKINGKLEDGSQIQDGEISFILNDGDVIVALDLGVSLMELGEKCELYTSSRYAYGELGSEPNIPKNASITFTLELIDVKPQADLASLSFLERLQLGEQKRLRGNYLFGRADYSSAIHSYTKAVKALDDTDLNAGLDESDRSQLEDSWTKCYNNMAVCQLKIDATDAAIRSAEKVLLSQPNNVKALFRIGKAYGAKGDVNKGISYLKKASQLDSESKMIHQELYTLTKRKNKETESEREMYRKMLGVKATDKSVSAEKEKQSSHAILRWAVAIGGMAAVAASVGLAWYRNS